MNEALLTKTADAVERVTSELFGDHDDSYPKLKDKIKAIDGKIIELSALNLNDLVEKIDQIKSKQSAVEKAIRENRNGFYVSGLEDVSEEFSLIRAMVAIKTKDWRNAGLEKEILDRARQKKADVFGKVTPGQSVGDDEMGGYFVPDQVIPDVIGAIYRKSVLINLAGEGPTGRITVIDGLTGSPAKVPKFDGGVIAYWIGEEDDYVQSAAKVGDVSMSPRKLGVYVKITDSMRKMGAYGFEGLLRNDMTRAAADKLDWTALYGIGSDDMPLGIANQPDLKIYQAETGNVLTQAEAAAYGDWQGKVTNFDLLSQMMLALEEDDIELVGSPIISCPRFFNWLKELKVSYFQTQTMEQAYLLGAPMFTDAELAAIIGAFDKTTRIPSDALPGQSVGGNTTSTDAKFTDVLAGNLTELMFGRWFGLEIEDDGGMGVGFPSDHTFMKMRMYCDFALRQPRGLMWCPDAKIRE